MIIKTVEFKNQAILSNLNRLTSQIYKLLPSWEECADWQTPLTTITEELAGMGRVMPNRQDIVFCILCKLEGLFGLTSEEDFFSYRRTIFECLNLLQTLKDDFKEEE